MKIACISDTHSFHDRVVVPEADVLVFAGDFTLMGEKYQVEGFNDWLGKQPHPYKLVIAGNHELTFDGPRAAEYRALLTNCIYLENSGIEINGVKFWGSPVTPEFCNWAFMKPRGAGMVEHWKTVPPDVDVLISHGPPKQVLDTSTPLGEHLGCEALTAALVLKRFSPRLVVFGHIHGGRGVKTLNGCTYVNASAVDEAYKPYGLPAEVVEI